MMPEYSTLTSVPIRPRSPAAQSAEPSATRLSLEPTLSRSGMFDGAWWPSTRDARAELPGLLEALSLRLGPVAQVGLDIDAWDEVPHRLVVGGRVVQVGWSPARDHTLSVTCRDQNRFLLLVIPPQSAPTAAATATWLATRTGNSSLAAEIFAAAWITPALAGPAITARAQ
jgi:hypothetical protein